MKILYVTTAYPPFIDMQTIRNIKLINQLVQCGNTITVISPDANWLPKNNHGIQIRSEVNVWRTKPPIFIRLQHILSLHKYLRIFLKTFNILSNYLLIPDIFTGWTRIAKKVIAPKLKLESFNLVITASGGYSAHFIGSWIAKKYNIRWVADYGDPWGLNIYGQKKIIYSILESRLLRNCSGLFFTTQSTIDAYKNNYKLKNIPIFKLPCGFDYTDNNEPKDHSQNGFIFTYTGVAYSLSRNLSNAVIALSKLNTLKVSFQIVGSYSEKFVNVAHKINATNINFCGKVNFKKSLEIISTSDILLHIGNFGTTQIPGKTYIYLGTPKPILYIRQEKKFDPTQNLLSQFGGVVFSENNPDSIEYSANQIINNYNYYLKMSIDRVKSKELLQYSWENLGDYFNSCIKEIVPI